MFFGAKRRRLRRSPSHSKEREDAKMRRCEDTLWLHQEGSALALRVFTSSY